VSTGDLSLTREDVSLASVVHRVVADADAEIRRRASPVEVRADDSAVGCWDRYRLEQVIENLLSNALKFGAGAPIEIRVWSEGERAMVSVCDRGIGIPRELHERIFEPFERGRVSSRHYGGLGLGLHITRSIVHALGGSVRVESEPGRGATFTVCLPKGAQ
jgi:signal transduction histidine kinase